MDILGISGFYHDSAACLVRDGRIIGVAQEERFSRKKHDLDFPAQAINWCLKKAEISVSDLDYVVFYDKPFIRFDRVIETSLAYAPSGIKQFIHSMPLWLKQRLWVPEVIQEKLGYQGKVLFCGHQESHAASAFYPSPFTEAAFLTIDDVGEWETASFGAGRENSLEVDCCLKFPHSLSLLYSAFTYYAGFRVDSDEHKLMDLSLYGQPHYVNVIFEKLVDVKDDGSFKLNMEYFGFCNGLRMTNRKFERLFGAPPHKPEMKITQKEMDLAASIQKVTEEIILKMVRHVYKVTRQKNLCLAGGVALNCVSNGRILREGPFKNIWIQPSSGDAGGALGAALLIWYKYLSNKRIVIDEKKDFQQCSLLGPLYEDIDIANFLKQNNIPAEKINSAELPLIIAKRIKEGNVIGWFQGGMEFGPVALGSRSIIADARNLQIQAKMNLKIKFRESFYPFALTVLTEQAGNWFDLDRESPYGLLAAQVKEDKKFVVRGTLKLARVQTVNREDNPLYYDTINEFFKMTGCPVIINTSFNVSEEPLVCTPGDAFKCFMRTEIDYLVMGNYLLDKRQQSIVTKVDTW
jgi:carbamoyltransferase